MTNSLENLEIPRHLRAEATHVALCINAAMGEIRERALTAGCMLLSIKSQLAPGVFTRWVESETFLTIRTAENYMLAYSLTRDCPQLNEAKGVNLDALYQLGRIADSDERRETLRRIVESRRSAKPAAVIAEFRAVLGLPATRRVSRSLAARHPSVIARGPIEASALESVAGALGDRLSEFVDLVRNHGASAVCDALAAICHRQRNERLSFSKEVTRSPEA